jgi:hypothetical protein
MIEQLDQIFTTVNVSHDIPEQRVRDLLCSAWEGGSNYWCNYKSRTMSITGLSEVNRIRRERKAAGEDFYVHEYPFIDGVALILEVNDEDDPRPLTLDRAALIRGLQVMAEKYPRQFHNFLIENDDAETGDTFLQCCLFGETVYG